MSLMVMASVNPHRLGLSGTLKTELPVEIKSPSIGNDHVLVEAFVASHESVHKPGADTTPLVVGMDEKMRVIDDKVAVGDCVAEADETLAVPCREERMRAHQSTMQLVRLLRRGPPVRAVESDDALDGEVARFSVLNAFVHR